MIVQESKSRFVSKLVHIKHPILRIPNLAIHLNRTANENFKFNQEDNMVPILGLLAAEQLNQGTTESATGDAKAQSVGAPNMQSKHHSVLLQLLASELGCTADEIQDFELSLYDTQPAAIGGVDNAFIFSPRLDNQSES